MIRYFNITYKCNQECLFCAADLFEHNDEDMTLREFTDIIEKSGMVMGDKVIINGGEPTCSIYFRDIIEYCKDKGFRIDLFTNGRYFKNSRLCESVFDRGDFYVRIPLFGMEIVHDYLTGRKGNFLETIQGVENIVKYVENTLTIEIKLLLSKETVKHNLMVVKYLKDLGIANRCSFSLNPLIVSKTVVKNHNMFCDDYALLIHESCPLFEYCEKNGIDIITSLLPICILPEEYKDKLMKNYCNHICEVFYNDKENVKSDVVNNTFGRIERCDVCNYCDICPKFPKTYIDYINK